MPQYYIGTSGWEYKHWRGRFYPKGLVQKRELEYLADRLNSVEVNGSFYSLQRPSSYARWAAAVPEGFRFALKGSRFITHMKHLNDIEVPLANFLASGPLALGEKLGPIVWQLPTGYRFNATRIEAFLQLLPRDTEQAARLARRHDARLEGRALVEPLHAGPMLHALEVRHESFRDARFFELLRAHGVASAGSDGAGRWPLLEEVTADFVYLRLHGSQKLYRSDYTDAELGQWAEKLRAWNRDAYVYFDNDEQAYAPFNALTLMTRLGVRAVAAEDANWAIMEDRKAAA